MVQTEVQLTEEQMTALKELAEKQSISISELVRESINNLLSSMAVWNKNKDVLKKRAIAVSGRFKSGLGDLSRRHDDYLAKEI
ncbi:MAG: ribbon-helix-helix domain-containing protein [bacterium]